MARSHQRVVYSALFEASSEALRTLAADPRFVGTNRLGFFGVLHTWGRTLEYHPHVHYVVPGGGVSGGRSVDAFTCSFLRRGQAVVDRLPREFRDLLDRAGLLGEVDPKVWTRPWVVHSRRRGTVGRR